MRLQETIKNAIRDWLLTDAERALVRRVKSLEGQVQNVQGEWSGLQQALEDADVIEDGAVIENADILVLTGRNHVVQGGKFNGTLYVNGRDHIIEGNVQERA